MALDLFINNGTKTKEELLKEVKILRAQLAVFEETEAERKRLEEEIKKSNEHLEYRILERTRELVETNKELRIKIKAHRQALDVFKEQEESFRLLFMQNPSPMLVYDLNTLEILKTNDAFVLRYGYSRDELLNMKIVDIRPPEDVPKLLVHLKDERPVLQYSGEWRHLLKNGEIIDVEIASHKLDFDSRKAALVIAKEITETKKAEKVLKESEEKYRKLIECANDAIFIADIESGLIIHANKKAEELMGASLNEIVGIHFTELHPSEEIEKYRLSFADHVDKQGAISEELYICRKDGTRIPVEISSSVIEIGGKKVIQGIFRDLRRWKQSENALLEAQRKLSTLIDNLPGIAYRCANDKNWTMEYLSEGCYELTGYKAEELIGNRVAPYNSLIFLEDQLKVWETVQNAILKKQLYIVEYRIKSKSNEEKWVWEKGCCVYGARGEILALEGFISDITERKKLQLELEQAIQREKQEREISSIEDLANFSNSSDVTAKLFSIAPLYESRPGIFNDLVKRYENLVDLAANESNNKLSPIILDELHFIGRQIITLKASHNDVMEMHSRVMKIENRQKDSKKAEVCTEKGRIMILELMCFLVSAYRKQLLISKDGSLQKSC